MNLQLLQQLDHYSTAAANRRRWKTSKKLNIAYRTLHPRVKMNYDL